MNRYRTISMWELRMFFCWQLLRLPGASAMMHPDVSELVEEKRHARHFRAFAKRHGRSYKEGSTEYDRRHALFRQHFEAVERHNSRSERLWTAGVNHLSDWTDAELKSLRGWSGGVAPGGSTAAAGTDHGMLGPFFLQTGTSHAKSVATTVSWTNLTASSSVLDQGACGGCWAVAAISVLNMHSEIHTTNRRTFSAYDIMNCMPNPDNCGGQGGCAGATVELAMNYVMHSGVSTAEQKPYQDSNGKCDNPSSPSTLPGAAKGSGLKLTAVGFRGATATTASAGLAFGMGGWERLPENKYEPLMRSLAELGPVAIAVAADGWQHYASGIFDSCARDVIIDHAVTLVGYGHSPSTEATKYWQIQNSWGPSWGEGGRIRLLRQTDEDAWCGVDKQPELGTGCDGGPKEVKVCGMCGMLYDSVVPYFQKDVKSSPLEGHPRTV